MNKRLGIIIAVALALVFSVSLAAIAEDGWDNGVEGNLALYPNWIGTDAQGLPTTMPIFNYSASGYINEAVWVELPCDTDRDGRRDRISVYIRRPVTVAGFKCPAVMELSPYHFSNPGYSRMSAYINNSDEHVRNMANTFRYKDNYPITIPVNPDTTHLTYDDIKYKGTEAWDSIWWQDSAFVADSWYTDPVPADTVSGSVAATGPTTPTNSIARNQQFFVRGYALMYAQLLGANNCTGITSSLHVEEWLCGAAIAQWLRGDCKAFTSRNGDVEVKATWSNGNVAMDGTSYPGTTPLVTAMTGVPGIKAIMPEANVTSWYEYYRSGGGLHCPAGYGGEDMNLHASYNFTRVNADSTSGIPPAAGPNFPKVTAQEAYVSNQLHMQKVQDRTTGDYNAEWDVRNLTRGFGKIKSDVGILQTNGQMDWNVMPRHAYMMLQGMRDRFTGTHKLVSGLSTHSYQYGRLYTGKDGVERGGLKWYLMFLDKFLLGLDTKVDELMYDIYIANNITGVMEGYDYDTLIEERGTIIPGTRYQKLYLTPGPEGKAGRLSYYAPVPAVDHFKDMDIIAQIQAPAGLTTTSRPATTFSLTGDGNYRASSAQGNWCDERLVGVHRTTNYTATQILEAIDKPVEGRLMYLSEPLSERVMLSGAATVHLKAAPDRGMGNLSVALFEIGRKGRIDSGRAGSSPGTTGSTTIFPAVNGASAVSASRYANPVGSTQSNYKWVTWGHTDVQNPSTDGKTWYEVPEQNYTPNFYFQTTELVPGRYYDYIVELAPYINTFEVDTRIGIMVYGTDVQYVGCLTPACTAEFDVQLGVGSYVDIPLKLAEAEEAVIIEVADVLGKPGGMVDVTYKLSGNVFGFTNLDLKIPYNKDIYTPKTIVPDTLLAPYFVANPNYEDGMMRVAFASKENVMGEGLLFTVTYEVAAGAPGTGDYPLNVLPVKMQYEGFMDKLVDLEVAVGAGTLVIGILGDVNGDGFVTPEDAILILQMLVGLVDWTPRALLLGDINGNGAVDTTDAALILRMVVGG